MHNEHLICAITRLTEQVERVACLYAQDLEWRRAHAESWLSWEDHQVLMALVARAEAISRKLKVLARKLDRLDDSTNAGNGTVN